jgi:hypothetical protein
MAILTLKILASLLQMHGPGATIQSDHPGINALLDDVREQISEEGAVPNIPEKTDVAFRRGASHGEAELEDSAEVVMSEEAGALSEGEEASSEQGDRHFAEEDLSGCRSLILPRAVSVMPHANR